MTRSRSRAVHRVPERASRSVDHERGSVTLLAASVMLLAGIMCVVSVDLARGLQGRARAQVAADSAALAAAQEMALPGGRTPTEIAGEFASLNGAVLVSCKCASTRR